MRNEGYDVETTRVVVVSYAAKSTEDTHGSIDSQLVHNRTYAEQRGWEVVDEFSDEAASAYKSSRGPGLAAATARAAELAAAGGVEVVLLVFASDRLARGDGRKAKHLVEYVLDAMKDGYRVEAVTEDLGLGGEMALVFASLYGQRANADSAAKGNHVRRGKRAAAERGKRNGGPRPFGYEHRVLGIDEQSRKPITKVTPVRGEAGVLPRMHREFQGGMTQSAIARGLALDGIKTTRGGAWTQSQVSAALRSRLYLGEVSYRGEWFPGEHEAIVDADLFEATQRLLAGPPMSRGGRPSREPFLLGGGLFKCGSCASTMRVRTRTPGKRVGKSWTAFYRCMGRESGSHPECRMPAIARDAVDPYVFEYFARAALDVDAILAALDRRFEQEEAIVRGQIEVGERDAARARERLERVRRDYQDGRLDAGDWGEQRIQLSGELRAAEEAVALLHKRETDLAVEAEEARAEQQGLEVLAAVQAAVAGDVTDADSVEAARAALSTVFECFVLHREPFMRPRHWDLLGVNDAENYSLDAEDEVRGRNIIDAGLLFEECYIEPIPRDDAIVRHWKLSELGDVVEGQELRRVGIAVGSIPPQSSR